MKTTGRIIINQVRKGKEYAVILPTKSGGEHKQPVYGYKFPESWNGKECEVEMEAGKIIRIWVDGQEVSRQADDKPKQPEPPHASNKHWQQKAKPKEESETPPDSIKIEDAQLPMDTKGLNYEKVDNFNLKLNKVARLDVEAGSKKFKFFKTDRGRIVYKIQPDFGDYNFPKYANEYRNNLKTMFPNLLTSKFRPNWRLIVGLGNESVYETSMMLHHIYGIPYIPGSAVKGVVRSWIIQELFNGEEKLSENGALKDEGFCRLFGSPKESSIGEHQGSVIFFDAFPIEQPEIEPDIMNPHYGPYYSDESGKTPPADYHNPVPVPFLTVKDADFEFHAAIVDDSPFQQSKLTERTPTEVIKKWLPEALREHGIGAKTAVGYGYMKDSN